MSQRWSLPWQPLRWRGTCCHIFSHCWQKSSTLQKICVISNQDPILSIAEKLRVLLSKYRGEPYLVTFLSRRTHVELAREFILVHLKQSYA